MLFAKYKCMICGRETKPAPGTEYDIEELKEDICDDCRTAVLFMRQVMAYEGIVVKGNNGCYQLLSYKRTEE